jgi:tRNA 2-selenouridine synthase
LRAHFLDRPKHWKPLIYCWRGGNRSGAMTTVFRAIGWGAGQLHGGYKHYRNGVVSALEELPAHFQFKVICGATGSAKTRVLQAIGDLGEQVLDLESLASHKGSVLGVLPDEPQPAQKGFETLLLQKLKGFDQQRPVYVEAESRKIGNLQVPQALIEGIRRAECLEIRATLSARIQFLLGDYAYFLSRQPLLLARLAQLHGLQSNEILARWHAYVDNDRWPELVQELLEIHYDPLYQRSQDRNFSGFQNPRSFLSEDLSADGIKLLAEQIIEARSAQIA